MATRALSGWGRYPIVDCAFRYFRDPADAVAAVGARDEMIARGNGRGYGDAALNPGGVLSTLRADRLLRFDPATGIVSCEAGMLLADLIEIIVPRGFFVPVTPGTKYVTIGGMIAADVHGKNHHVAGTFCRHVLSLDLLTADGTIRGCSREAEPELFLATCGGMGLTGVILAATFRLIRIDTPFLRQETVRAENVEAAMAACAASSGWTYGVAWIDCLARGSRMGRSLIYRAEHAAKHEVAQDKAVARRRPRRLGVDLPGIALNRWSMRTFNSLYYRRAEPGQAIIDWDRYFYPLDAVLDWNRGYGRGGFVQYQCVIPLAASRMALQAILERVSAAGSASFLAVLKLFGPEGDGMLSFPLEGYTLTLDFPATARNFNLLLALDRIVADHGGRLYLAKDARMGATMMASGYPRLDQFRAVRRAVDPHGKFASLLSERLGI